MENFRLLFSYQDKFYDLREITQRGYLNAVVEINFQKFYEIVFYTFDEMDFVKKSGGYYFAEAGMVIISELKKDIMLKAVRELYENSIFFDGLKDYPVEKYKYYKEADFD
jgi:hypothetical protein